MLELAEEHLQLVGVPAVVLVGQSEVARLGRGERERALEVSVEAAADLGRHEHEALVARQDLVDPR